MIDFVKFGTVSVSEVLANLDKFNGQACADPFEDMEYGTTTAKFYANRDNGKPCINSQAHGGMMYFLQPSVTGAWENPKPLPISLPDVEAFDYRLLPAPLEPWARDICERVGCPPDYVAVAVMTALGAVIGRKVGIRPQSETDWTVTSNQWALCVGRPGVLSSPTESGKTTMALDLVAGRRQPALVMVHSKELADQWIERIEQFLGIPGGEVGRIGGGKMSIGKKITVSLVQSLYKCASEVSPHSRAPGCR